MTDHQITPPKKTGISTIDYRALCAELVDDVEVLLVLRPPNARTLWTTEERLTRARAALAVIGDHALINDLSK